MRKYFPYVIMAKVDLLGKKFITCRFTCEDFIFNKLARQLKLRIKPNKKPPRNKTFQPPNFQDHRDNRGIIKSPHIYWYEDFFIY